MKQLPEFSKIINAPIWSNVLLYSKMMDQYISSLGDIGNGSYKLVTITIFRE